MKATNVVPVSVLAAVVIGLLILDVTTDAEWAWWAIAIALAAALKQIVRPGRRTCSPGGGR